jgi:GTPase SAR1 family protein
MNETKEMFKILVIGSDNIGKTNFISRYIRDEYNESQKSTIGIDYFLKIVQVGNQKI